MSTHSQTNRIPGYPSDDRLLIINADDFGMYYSVNAVIIGTLKRSIVHSTTLMTPCRWLLQASHWLADHPEIPFGIRR